MENNKYPFDAEKIEASFDDYLSKSDYWQYNCHGLAEAFSDYIESEHLTKLKDQDYVTSLYEYAKKEYPDDDKYFKWLKIFIEKDK